MYHATEAPEGTWAQVDWFVTFSRPTLCTGQVVSITNVGASFKQFRIHSDNNTFADATATVTAVAGINVIAMAKLLYTGIHG